jgi:hypothetical protein
MQHFDMRFDPEGSSLMNRIRAIRKENGGKQE